MRTAASELPADVFLQEGRLAQLEEQMNIVLDQSRHVSFVATEVSFWRTAIQEPALTCPDQCQTDSRKLLDRLLLDQHKLRTYLV